MSGYQGLNDMGHRRAVLAAGMVAAKEAGEKVALQQQIEVMDQQIDQLVYGLYGLTAAEVAVVEDEGDEVEVLRGELDG